jgi:hypothetical protein
MRTTKDSIPAAARGRPGARCAVPSYFWAISFRRQASKVSGVTMVATSARIFRPKALARFKAHYREHGATAGNHRRFMQFQYSDHTGESSRTAPVIGVFDSPNAMSATSTTRFH